MNPPKAISLLLRRLWVHISQRRRMQVGLILVLMVIASIAEILSISAVLPFLAVLSAPSKVFENPVAQPFILKMGFTEPQQLLFPITIIFSMAAISAGVMRLFLLWSSTRLSFAVGADLSISMFRRTLYQPYSVHVARNSSEVINGIWGKTGNTIAIINMSLNLISAVIILIAIIVTLLYVDPVVTFFAFSGFGLIYAVIMRLTRKRLLKNSEIVARESDNVVKSLQEGLGGIRDVLIDGSQKTYCQIYSNADQPLRRAQAHNTFITSAPRFGIEPLGILVIAALAYSLAQQSEGLAAAVPVLGALALGAQRLLPSLQQAYGSWSGILAGQTSLQDTLDLLDQALPDYAEQPTSKPLPFNQHIRLKNLSFRYTLNTPWVLNQLNLTIFKGSRVGFIGTTGSGKSTLLDIVMGLLPPTEGTLEVDGLSVNFTNCRAWQAHIAHVPQAIFLADCSIEENIAFGVPKSEIDHAGVRRAAQQAQIADIIESWPRQYQTYVGERGIRLSGGQRQRIGIARALYKNANVIIFDEATSSLDNDTEQAVMEAIKELSADLTVLIIAHRLSTLQNCTQVVQIGEAGIKSIGTYQDIVSQNLK
jgi:ATP-binding cassette subfamily B protein